MKCENFLKSMNEGTISPQMQEHLLDCNTCRSAHQTNELVGKWLVRKANEEVTVPDLLWSKIEKELPPSQIHQRKYLVIGYWHDMLEKWSMMPVLTLVLIVSLLGPGAFLFSVNQAYDLNSQTEATLRNLEIAEQKYIDEIEKLSSIVGVGAEVAPDSLFSLYNKKLIVLDEIIEECNEALRNNQLNMNVRTNLLAAYKEKVDTLEAITKLVFSS
ncbi:MAG: hypothetical protein COB20_06760 [SAR86 cluster bacterium]|uniref:Zinc-finger domain-containing protein n=1 Tax=SAR86 cluster bacterium TaxID=2030880 RepID=A0A2A4X753_9GAMM|nr:MAG: hypothetical protein COB20_06760 [SAR86 cluster bacterium]